VKRTLGVLFTGACAMSCAGSPFRGGHAEPEGPVRGIQILQSFIPGHCEDAHHVEHAPRFSAVDLVQSQSGRLQLFEHREGHERLTVENFHGQGSFWVFEVVVHGDHVRRFRIPRSLSGTGSVEVGREIQEETHGERFEAGLASTRAQCTLVPKAAFRAQTPEKLPESAAR